MRATNVVKTVLFIALIHLMAFSAKAQSSAENKEAPRTSDKLNIDKLEEKYWSVKDDDFNVVQNRAYTKAERFFASLQSGKLINDGFSEGSPTSLSIGYYKTEHLGYELNYMKWDTKYNKVTDGFGTNFGAFPNFNSPLSSTSIGVVFVPFYAKVSLMGKSILYFDMSIGVNAGTSAYKAETVYGGEDMSASHYGIDVTQTLFLNKNWALRFDIRNKWSTQEQLKYNIQKSAPESQRTLGTTQLQDTSMLLGVTFFY